MRLLSENLILSLTLSENFTFPTGNDDGFESAIPSSEPAHAIWY